MTIRTLAAAVVSVALASCAAPKDRLSFDAYAQMQPGVWTQADVRQALGEPDHRLVDIWLYERPEKHLVVKLEFDETGRLRHKEWIDGTAETWEDSADR